MFLISLLLPVREHRAADSFHSNWQIGGPHFEARWMVVGMLEGWGGVKVQEQAVAMMK